MMLSEEDNDLDGKVPAMTIVTTRTTQVITDLHVFHENTNDQLDLPTQWK